MSFASDTGAPAHPAVLAAHRIANEGPAPSYGGAAGTARLEDRLKTLFETDRLALSMVNSGTAANALLLATITPPVM